MKKIIEFVKKYKVHILASLCFIFFFRSCQKSGEIRKISKNNTESSTVVDSLNNVISVQKKTIDSIPQIIKDEKLKVHSEYDNYISSKNRGEQLMELHMLVKNNIKKLEN
jgi:PBP1b-binding outer membrane lipoprotein LpoB